jgi:hypothetical protein
VIDAPLFPLDMRGIGLHRLTSNLAPSRVRI